MLGMEVALVLMKENGEIEVEYDENLSDDCELTEVEEIGVAGVHVCDKH